MANLIGEVAETTVALVKGFAVTWKNMFRKTVTENYPAEPVHFQPRYRVEACPTDAITHGHGFELAPYDINSLVYRKEQMLEKPGGELPAIQKV